MSKYYDKRESMKRPAWNSVTVHPQKVVLVRKGEVKELTRTEFDNWFELVPGQTFFVEQK